MPSSRNRCGTRSRVKRGGVAVVHTNDPARELDVGGRRAERQEEGKEKAARHGGAHSTKRGLWGQTRPP